jgi:hypothetical protein
MGLCSYCRQEMTAQRKTKLYCSNACKQKAKRARKRAKQAGEWEVLCKVCQRPVEQPSRSLRVAEYHGRNVRLYCSDKCRQERRRQRAAERRYRVAHPSADDPYRVSRSRWQGEMLSCGHTTEWHELADSVLNLLIDGRLAWAHTEPTLFGDLPHPAWVPGGQIWLRRAIDGTTDLWTPGGPYVRSSRADQPAAVSDRHPLEEEFEMMRAREWAARRLTSPACQDAPQADGAAPGVQPDPSPDDGRALAPAAPPSPRVDDDLADF